MKLKHLISLVLLIALIGTVSATTQEYGNWTNFVVNSTSAQTNYQVKMILDNRTGSSATTLFYTNGTTRSDWMDIKWTDTSNTTLGFWKENRTDTTTNTTWWIKVPSIANDNTTKIRLFYGNASKTTSYADGDATFPLFDDFPGTTLNTSKWTTPAGTGTITVANSIMRIDAYKEFGSKLNFSQNYAYRSFSNYSRTVGSEGDIGSTGSGEYGVFYFSSSTNTLRSYTKAAGNSEVQTIGTTYHGTYRVFEVVRESTTSVKFYIDNELKTTHTTRVPTVNMSTYFIAGNTGDILSSDWAVVRKYSSPEPFLTVNVTSGGGTPSAPVASFTVNRNPTRIPNSITATDTSTNTPTSWEWSWGDGTANSTTQNPSHQYLKRGKWDIVLTATNAGGSGTTGATSVKVVGYENYY
jgi:PKD repeat protein